jgi:hypothetical protein
MSTSSTSLRSGTAIVFTNTSAMDNVHVGRIVCGKEYPITWDEQQKYNLITAKQMSTYFFALKCPPEHRKEQDKAIVCVYKKPLMNGYPVLVVSDSIFNRRASPMQPSSSAPAPMRDLDSVSSQSNETSESFQ